MEIIILSIILAVAILFGLYIFQKNRKLAEQLNFYRLVHESSKPTFFEYDIESKRVISSQALVELFGGGGGAKYGLVIEDFPDSAVRDGRIYEYDVTHFLRFYDDIRSGRKTQGNLELRIRDDSTGKYVWASAFVATMPFKSGVPKKAIGFMRDLNLTHKLTGIDNKDKFIYDATKILRQKSYTYAFVLIDLKDFALFNEVNGFDEGDNLLCHIADVIRLRTDVGELCAHSYSDRFYLLLRFSDKDTFKERVAEIIGDIKGYPIASGLHHTIEPYAGIYVVGNDNSFTIENIIDSAGIAQEHIRQHAKHEVSYFEAGQHGGLFRQKDMLAHMETDLLEDRFRLYVQPVFSLSKNKIVSGEVVVRWNSTLGVLEYSEYEKLFEKNKFIIKHDMHMFNNVCKLLKTWTDEGLSPVPLAVNFSRLHLFNPSFSRNLDEIVKKIGIPNSLIVIGLSEDVVFDHQKLVKRTVDELTKYGFPITLDGFGSKYSSLMLLKNIHFDNIKLDPMLFRQEDNSETTTAVVSGLLSLTDMLGKNTVAENVKSEEELRMLKELGCKNMQGFRYSEPVAPEEFAGMLFKD